MSMKRIMILFRKNFISPTLLLGLIPVFVLLVLGLGFRFTGAYREGFDIFFLPLLMDFLPLGVGLGAFIGFMGYLQQEKLNGTAEMLFSTPVTTREYMLSLWFTGLVISAATVYSAMGIFAVSLGIERVAAHVSPLVWLQPPLLIITLVSGSGLIASIMLRHSSMIKNIAYGVIVFAPIAIVMVVVGLMFITRFIGLVDLPEALPSWVAWLLETLQAAGEMVPSFVYSPWARWLPTSVYMLVWFFILSRKIHIGNFIRPSTGWRRLFFVPW
ncbi:hypothetical protein M1O12_04845 [Dehalococcoidia bacterium]|nr:hypothetical protein [Dehalococcoidia bacterium]